MQELILKLNIQHQLDQFHLELKDKKILIYGAGRFSKAIFDSCDISKFNIIGVCDKKFQENDVELFYNYKTYNPSQLGNIDFDYVIFFLLEPFRILASIDLGHNDKIFSFEHEYYKQINKQCIICNNTKLYSFDAIICPFIMDLMFQFKSSDKTNLLYCPNCETSYFEKRPNSEEVNNYYSIYNSEKFHKLRKHYEPHMYEENHLYMKGYSNWTYDFRSQFLHEDIVKYLPNIPQSWNVLDYGCSGKLFNLDFKFTNNFSFNLSKTDDIDDQINIINKIGEEHKNYFDFILCTHVLEHVSYPKDMIKEITTLLKPGGYLYIEIPDETGLTNDIMTYPLQQKYMHEHINLFSPKSIRVLFNQSNLATIFAHKRPCSELSYTGVISGLARKL